jgi:hypothetical protein
MRDLVGTRTCVCAEFSKAGSMSVTGIIGLILEYTAPHNAAQINKSKP